MSADRTSTLPLEQHSSAIVCHPGATLASLALKSADSVRLSADSVQTQCEPRTRPPRTTLVATLCMAQPLALHVRLATIDIMLVPCSNTETLCHTVYANRDTGLHSKPAVFPPSQLLPLIAAIPHNWTLWHALIATACHNI